MGEIVRLMNGMGFAWLDLKGLVGVKLLLMEDTKELIGCLEGICWEENFLHCFG